jgi:hypothetical protein
MPPAPAADELDNWAQENYSLSASAADDRAVPDQQQRQDAADQLHGFHLSRSWFRS